MILEADIEKALDWLRDHSDKMAQARAERLYMEQWIKTVLAQEQANQGSMSVAASEIIARISAPYKAALKAFKESVYEDERLKFMGKAADAKIEAYRTQCANERGKL